MPGQLLLVNPARRRRRRRNAMPAGLKRYWASRRRANPHHHRKIHHRRRRNIMSPLLHTAAVNPHRRRRHHVARRHNPIRHRRRRNPAIGLPGMRGFMSMIQQAAIQSAGAIALDYLYGYVNSMMPATLKRTPGSIGVGDAVKVVFNVLAGTMLSRPTRGFARKAAEGSMTVHFYQLISQSLPTTIQAGLAGNMGWYQPAPTIPGTQWVTPNRGRIRRNAPILSMFSRGSPSLSMVPTVASPFNVPMVVGAQAGVPIK